MEAKEQLKKLIQMYSKYKSSKKTNELSEEETRSWINELLKIFGWDVLNTQQIQQEKIISEDQISKLTNINSRHIRPDYALVKWKLYKSIFGCQKDQY